MPPNKELPKTALRAGGGTFPFRTPPPFIVCMSDPPPILHHLPPPLRHAWSKTIGLFKIVSVSCGINKLACYGTVHEKIAPLVYYKNVIKMHHVCIAITSQRLTLSTSYFHHFILHHFSTVECILESWTISVPTFLRAIPPGVQNYHIFV